MISRHFKQGEFLNLVIQLNGKEQFCGSVVEGSSRQVCSVVKVFDNLGTNFRGSQKALHQGSSTQIWVSNLYTPCVCV